MSARSHAHYVSSSGTKSKKRLACSSYDDKGKNVKIKKIEESKQKLKSFEEKRSSQKRSNSQPLPFGNCVGVSERFRKCGRVGEGTYGVVYKAEDRQKAGDFVALKRCLAHHEAAAGFPLTALREIQSLRLLQGHANVVSLRTDISMVAVSKNDVFLVFEYVEHDLADLLDHHYNRNDRRKMRMKITKRKGKSPFQESHVKTLLKQLLSAVECIHAHRLIHRDIKMPNLLYSSTGNMKLADFGLSRSLPAQKASDEGYHMTPNVVSLWYRPPELLLGSRIYNQSIDLWSAGCCFVELLQGFPLWTGKTESEQIDKIFSSLGYPMVETWPNVLEMPSVKEGKVSLHSSPKASGSSMPLLDSFSYLSSSGLLLLTQLLHYDASHQRWTAEQALESAYFTSDPRPTPTSEMPKFQSLHTK